MAGPTRVIIMAFSTDSGAPQPGAFICVMGDRHIFRINRCGALQPAAAACSSCEPGSSGIIIMAGPTRVIIMPLRRVDS